MLAILLISMTWTKENRTPESAVQRQKYYHPVRIEDDVLLSGNGIFVKKCDYRQEGNQVLSGQEICESLEKQYHEAMKNVPFTGCQKYDEKRAKRRNQGMMRDKGTFYDSADIKKIHIPCIEIIQETDCKYRIKWFDGRCGMPFRRGGNEDLFRPGARLAGQPNVLNETAFILKENESGMLKYNYRQAPFDDCQGYYYCYYVYMVNTDTLTRDVFMRAYDYEYDQMADLF
ncbi:MAG: hypothetical protein K2M91_13655 [Lachnospiraceae bacterium]|nr:hypothetical protein [Lachnospiraceae bacterium]